MKCLFCDSKNFQTQLDQTISPPCHVIEYREFICEKGHLFKYRRQYDCELCGPEKITLHESAWCFLGISKKFPGRMTDISIYEDNSWGNYRLSELKYCTDLHTKTFIIQTYLNQQETLKNERNTSRTAWLLCSLKLRKWINRDIAKMIGVYLNRKPFIFF